MAGATLRAWADLRTDPPAVLTKRLVDDGLVLFRCEPEPAEFLSLVSRILVVSTHRDADDRGLTTIRAVPSQGHRRPSYEAFSNRGLRPHTDGTSLPHPPLVVALMCVERAWSGGLTVLADGAEIYRMLRLAAPEAADALSDTGAAYFGAAPAHVDAVFRKLPDGKIAVRYRDDRFVRYGPNARDSARFLRRAVQQSTHTVNLDPGTGYLLQNSRWLHGRTAYRGQRLMNRVIGNAASSAIDAGLAGFVPAQEIGISWPAMR